LASTTRQTSARDGINTLPAFVTFSGIYVGISGSVCIDKKSFLTFAVGRLLGILQCRAPRPCAVSCASHLDLWMETRFKDAHQTPWQTPPCAHPRARVEGQKKVRWGYEQSPGDSQAWRSTWRGRQIASPWLLGHHETDHYKAVLRVLVAVRAGEKANVVGACRCYLHRAERPGEPESRAACEHAAYVRDVYQGRHGRRSMRTGERRLSRHENGSRRTRPEAALAGHTIYARGRRTLGHAHPRVPACCHGTLWPGRRTGHSVAAGGAGDFEPINLSYFIIWLRDAASNAKRWLGGWHPLRR